MNYNYSENLKEQTEKYYKEDDFNKSYPLIALRGRVIFPETAVMFDVGRKVSIKALKKAQQSEGLIFLSAQKDAFIESPIRSDIYEIGVVCKIESVQNAMPGSLKVGVKALYRAIMQDFYFDGESYSASVKRSDYIDSDAIETEAYYRLAKNLFLEYMIFDKIRQNKDAVAKILESKDSNLFIDRALTFLSFKEEDLQNVLNEGITVERLKLFVSLMEKEVEIAKIEQKISSRVKQNIDKNQKEFYLREQIKAIHTELGDDVNELEELKSKIKSKNLPSQVEEKCLKEIKRLDKLNPSSPDYSLTLNYIDWVLDLPFNKYSEDEMDIKKVRNVLELDHYGLDSVKKRIIEYISVLKLTGKIGGSILCLVGPPGVGKTSIAKSIAKSLNREFVRMSLGGLKDEAEIRGHRRTYVGAIPGRIIYGLKGAKTSNPVFLLDEIDKLTKDIQGDPSSALLEVLDPEQNSTFRDRYLEVDYDLSKVMFITTANTLDIPAPLLDRMELIKISGYTKEEKLEIAKRYLVPKQIKLNGITKNNVTFTSSGLKAIIDGYTLEAGVRNLEREIGAVCRKVATKIAEEGQTKVKIEKSNLKEYLGVVKFESDSKLETNVVGAANGLAWTEYGGTTLTIEVSLVEGKGEVILTGKLGDVMKESAITAVTYIKANAKKYNINIDEFSNKNIHIHVPEGATPKDGPSAGITIATAILSAFTKKFVKSSIAMTGEITLLGKVLPIGGLKEKALAAYRLGITDIIIPYKNIKDVEEIDEKIKSKINFIPVKMVNEVFERAIENL